MSPLLPGRASLAEVTLFLASHYINDQKTRAAWTRVAVMPQRTSIFARRSPARMRLGGSGRIDYATIPICEQRGNHRGHR